MGVPLRDQRRRVAGCPGQPRRRLSLPRSGAGAGACRRSRARLTSTSRDRLAGHVTIGKVARAHHRGRRQPGARCRCPGRMAKGPHLEGRAHRGDAPRQAVRAVGLAVPGRRVTSRAVAPGARRVGRSRQRSPCPLAVRRHGPERPFAPAVAGRVAPGADRPRCVGASAAPTPHARKGGAHSAHAGAAPPDRACRAAPLRGTPLAAPRGGGPGRPGRPRRASIGAPGTANGHRRPESPPDVTFFSVPESRLRGRGPRPARAGRRDARTPVTTGVATPRALPPTRRGARPGARRRAPRRGAIPPPAKKTSPSGAFSATMPLPIFNRQ